MAETGTSVQQEAPQTEQSIVQNNTNAIPAELVKEMETSLKPFVQDMQTTHPVNGEATVLPTNGEVKPTVETQEVPFSILKEKFGYENPEAAIKEIEELRIIKANPPKAEIKYENEQSEKIAKAIQAGKLTEVYQALHQQEKLNSLTSAEVTKDNAPEIIKMGMQLKYPTLTQQQIDFQFKQEYSVPKEPVMKDTEDETEFAERHNDWKEQVSNIQMKTEIAATMAKPELELAKSKIVFPEVEQSVDEGYIQYRKDLEEQPKLDAETKEAYGKLTPKMLETKIKFTDEPNKIDFEFQLEPDSESFQKTIDTVSDFSKLVQHFKKPDGTPDREGFAKAMYFALNHDKVLMEAMKQSKNATIKSFLPNNGSNGTQRQFPQHQELSELDKQMKTSLAGY